MARSTLVRDALRDLTSTVRNLVLLQASLSIIAWFVGFLLICGVLNLKWYYAIIPTLVAIVVIFRQQVRKANIYLVEHNIPEFKDILTTVSDTVEKSNEIIDVLHKETIQSMRRIKSSSFIAFGGMTTKVVVIVVLCIVTASLAAFNGRFIDVPRLAGKISLSDFGVYGLNESLLQYAENESLDIYGNKSVAELGYEELQLQITPVQSELDLNDIKDVEDKDFRASRSADDIRASVDATYSEDVPKEYRKIVKYYFNEISKDE